MRGEWAGYRVSVDVRMRRSSEAVSDASRARDSANSCFDTGLMICLNLEQSLR